MGASASTARPATQAHQSSALRRTHSREAIDEKRAAWTASRTNDAVDGATDAMAGLVVDGYGQGGSPLSSDGSIALDNLADWQKALDADPRLTVSKSVLDKNNLKVLLDRKKAIGDIHVYNTKLEFEGNKKVTNQQSSGRCWLFATTNVIRYTVAKKLGLEDFQLSQSYLFFYDKLNKANYYLELTLENLDLPLDDRLIVHLAQDPVSDGGQWDMVLNLLERYGVVPLSIYPESYASTSSGGLDTLVKTKLREHAILLRSSAARLRAAAAANGVDADDKTILAALRKEKEGYMSEIYRILAVTLGEPPKPDQSFTWEYYTAKGEYKSWKGTPIEYFKTFGNHKYPHLEAFSLINDPRHDYDQLYTVSKLGNVWGGKGIRYVNTTSERLKDAVIKTIKAGQPVFFGSDVGQSSDSKSGVMDVGLFDYENAFGISFGLSKEDRLRTGESAMTHAMVITAVHLDVDGKPLRYKVENSWGPGSGQEGWFMMTDKWFDEFVYQVVVPRQLAPTDLVKILDTAKPVVLPPWDPLGALA